MFALTVDFRKHSGPTPADDMAAQIITDCGNFTLDFKQHGFCASPLFLQNLDFQMKYKIYFHLKRGLWTTEHQSSSSSLSPGKMLLTMFLFQKWLVALFLKMSERGDSWLQLQFTPCEALPSVRIGFAWQYSQACGHPCCLCTFSYPISSFQSTLHLTCFDTALCEQSPLSVMPLCVLTLFVEGINDHLLDHCQVSSVPHYCGFKE